MKKIFFALLLFCFSQVLLSQTILSSHPLELKTPENKQQILTALNQKYKQVFVFASDKDNIKILKYNSALFLTDSLYAGRPNERFRSIAGYSFGEKTASLYWASEDFTQIEAVTYDLEHKTSVETLFDTAIKKGTVISTFNENNGFYILTTDLENSLKLLCFRNGKYEEETLDFSGYELQSEKSEKINLKALLEQYPIQEIISSEFSPLVFGIRTTKLYLTNDHFILTFDQNSFATQLFEIDLNSYAIYGKTLPQPQLEKTNGRSNSYIDGDNLYQLMLNDEEMKLDIKNYKSDELLKSYTATQAGDITFKNSPYWVQEGDQPPRELKNVKKFLKRLSSSTIGLTVYHTSRASLITLGGARDYATAGGVVLGVAELALIISSGGGGFDSELFTSTNSQLTYVESVLDEHHQHTDAKPELLAVDFISNFMNEHSEISLGNTLRFRNYYIFGYYDSRAKKYTMRKFEDAISN